MPGVSVIIRVRDERANLVRCPALLEAQRDVGETEVIVVDAGSRDGTPEVARTAGARLSHRRAARLLGAHRRRRG